MVDPAALPGWYGKLPSLGDFASRRLPQAFIRPWDTWLQHGLEQARAAWGDDWLEVYLVSPIWRFWVAPGVLGAPGWAGLLMPSVDAVGRHFPLTVAWPAQTLPSALQRATWFDAGEQAARDALDPMVEPEDFDQALLQVAADTRSRADATAVAASWLAEGDVRRAGPSPSLWWTGEAAPDSLWRPWPGLPPAADFPLLLEDPT